VLSDTERRWAINSVVRALRAVAVCFQVTGSLSVQPDVQFVFDPHLSRRDPTPIELRAVIDLYFRPALRWNFRSGKPPKRLGLRPIFPILG
jgi:hypothetical protein